MVVAVAERAVVIELELLVVEPVVVEPVVLVESTSVDLQDSKVLLKPSRISRKIGAFFRFMMLAKSILFSA